MIGTKPMDQVGSADVVEVLSPIWLEIPDTARRILQRIGAVLDFAHLDRTPAQIGKGKAGRTPRARALRADCGNGVAMAGRDGE